MMHRKISTHGKCFISYCFFEYCVYKLTQYCEFLLEGLTWILSLHVVLYQDDK